MKIMRLFDVRPLWAVMRGVDCSGHMKALQSIWTMSGHYGRGTETPWRSADFMKGYRILMMEATAESVTLLTSRGRREKIFQRC